ncbi:25584_t:CDS:2 [Gigaspora rosea]|nr:25584_t:CDS:2 [Gigaspora rosea]
MSKRNSRFVSSTREVIAKFQQASRNKNTDKSMNVWMDLLYKFCQMHRFSNEIKELDDKTLLEQVKQFIVEVRKSNGQEYKASSLYTGYCAIAQGFLKNLYKTLDGHMKSIVDKGDKNRKQSDPLEVDEIKLILDSPATSTNNPKGLLRRVWLWVSLLCCLRGGDAKSLKASWLKELDNAGSSFIPPDISGNTYTPVADIKKYLSKRPDDTEDDLFFVALNTSKKIYHELDFKCRTITNHSMRSTGIHSLVESGVTLDEQIIFSRHKTIAGVSAYQHQFLKQKLDNVSYLIPVEEAEPSVLKDSTAIHNNQIEFSKASDLLLNASDLIPNKQNKKIQCI